MSLQSIIFYICFSYALAIDDTYSGMVKNEISSGIETSHSNLTIFEASSSVHPNKSDSLKKSTVYILSNYKDMILSKNKELMEDDENVFYFKMINSIVYYDKADYEWYEILFSDFDPKAIVIQKYKELIPITYCLDNNMGDGGSVSSSQQITISVTDEYYNTIDLRLTLTLSAVIGLSVNPTLSYTNTYTCSVGKGQNGRLYIEPYYVEIPDFHKRRVEYSTRNGIIGIDEEFEEVDGFKLLTKYRPNHYCVIAEDSSILNCGSPTMNTYFTIN